MSVPLFHMVLFTLRFNVTLKQCGKDKWGIILTLLKWTINNMFTIKGVIIQNVKHELSNVIPINMKQKLISE